MNAFCFCSLFALSLQLQTDYEPQYYEKVLRHPVVGKHVYQAWKDTETDRVYLGTINDKRGRPVYKVVTEFRRVQAAIVKHGSTTLFFFDMHDRIKAECHLTEKSPIRLHRNRILFESSEDSFDSQFDVHHQKSRRHWEYIPLPLPEFIQGAHEYYGLISPP
jgi:hypothetical protein